jgi:hypothetical protein
MQRIRRYRPLHECLTIKYRAWYSGSSAPAPAEEARAEAASATAWRLAKSMVARLGPALGFRHQGKEWRERVAPSAAADLEARRDPSLLLHAAAASPVAGGGVSPALRSKNPCRDFVLRKAIPGCLPLPPRSIDRGISWVAPFQSWLFIL